MLIYYKGGSVRCGGRPGTLSLDLSRLGKGGRNFQTRFARGLFEIIYAALENGLDAGAGHVLIEACAAALRMPHLAQHPAVRRAYGLHRQHRAVRVRLHVHRRFTGEVHILRHQLAAALELYQASALVHDDIIDHADERRGQPTPHRALATRHSDAGWIGSSSAFGLNAAILVGDFLFSAATAQADEQALRVLQKKKHRREFKLSLHGWMEFRIAAVDLSTDEISTNRAGREFKKSLRPFVEAAKKFNIGEENPK